MVQKLPFLFSYRSHDAEPRHDWCQGMHDRISQFNRKRIAAMYVGMYVHAGIISDTPVFPESSFSQGQRSGALSKQLRCWTLSRDQQSLGILWPTEPWHLVAVRVNVLLGDIAGFRILSRAGLGCTLSQVCPLIAVITLVCAILVSQLVQQARTINPLCVDNNMRNVSCARVAQHGCTSRDVREGYEQLVQIKFMSSVCLCGLPLNKYMSDLAVCFREWQKLETLIVASNVELVPVTLFFMFGILAAATKVFDSGMSMRDVKALYHTDSC